MEFRLGNDYRALFLPRRSLLVMSGPARYQWAHYIPHRKRDVVDEEVVVRSSHRVSFTFRQVCARCSERAFEAVQYYAGDPRQRFTHTNMCIAGARRAVRLWLPRYM